ncbi:hypothetical protein EZV62_004927 [Acer yangbiense]|uniref:Uncharacterized protein n=1 Tax=Acer yangbiense TaxID=1000413 RepID=A0A5C7IN71_9ROSI|nr:hypothetical protein EZV62_004927 [Acer yangbiense]
MEATKFSSSNHYLLHHPSLLTRPIKARKPLNVSAISISSSGSNSKGGDYGGRLVDENMIVLRMRIRENKMLETRNEPPSNWMEWEKRYYEHNGYNEDVFEALGFVQKCLMNNRPALALVLIALLTLSLVISTGVVLFHAIEIAQIIIFFLFHLSCSVLQIQNSDF